MVSTLFQPQRYRSCTAVCWCFFLLSCLFASANVHAAELVARVDRQTVIDGESVVLYLEGTDIPGSPDTSALLTNFRILQSGSSTSQSIVNGKRTSGQTMRFELQPKNVGSSVIPAFSIAGASSKPITIEVVPRGTPGVEPRDKVFAELSVDNDNPYVQQQVMLSLKIFDDGNLASADPDVSGNSDYQIEPLPLAREQIVERNGVQYRVNTFRYALFPQQSGDITLDAISIPASIRDKSYGGNLILFNTPTRRIEIKTDSLSLSVKPRAAASTSGWWLPVKGLELKHEWSGDISRAKAGEPFTLTLEMLASGATSTQLPDMTVPDVPGLKIYVDNPELGSKADADNLISVRREKWSVIPSKSGEITLPEMEVKWWDTEADVERRSVIPAQKIRVSGDLQSGAEVKQEPETVSSAVNNAVTAPQLETDDASDASADMDNPEPVTTVAMSQALRPGADSRVSRTWLWLTFLAATAWLLTLLGWWWSVHRLKSGQQAERDKLSASSSERGARRRMQSLSQGQDVSAYRAAVLEWSQSKWPDKSTHNLPQVGMRLESAELTESLRRLDQQRYSGNPSANHAVSLDEIHNQLEAALQSSPPDRAGPHALPPL